MEIGGKIRLDVEFESAGQRAEVVEPGLEELGEIHRAEVDLSRLASILESRSRSSMMFVSR